MQERYTHILERWFISEPPLFQVLCIHELVQNTQMSCPLRSGRKKLEYHPEIVREMSDEALEEALRAEAVRLLLKHPYERRPDGCSQKSMGLASNLVVADFPKTISVIRSREIYVSIMLQSISQLTAMYGESNAKTILANCDHCLLLGCNDVDTARYFSVKANVNLHRILDMSLDNAWFFERGSKAREVTKAKPDFTLRDATITYEPAA